MNNSNQSKSSGYETEDSFLENKSKSKYFLN